MPRQETKEGAFTRIAEKRVRRALKDIELIGQLSNRHNYAYTIEQVDKIFNALREQIEEERHKFSVSRSVNFSLQENEQ